MKRNMDEGGCDREEMRRYKEIDPDPLTSVSHWTVAESRGQCPVERIDITVYVCYCKMT